LVRVSAPARPIEERERCPWSRSHPRGSENGALLKFALSESELRALAIDDTPCGMGNEIVSWKVEPIERARGLDERLLIAAPRLLRLVAYCLRRPAGSRLRRVVITRLLQVGLAANNRGDYKALSTGLHPNVELHFDVEGAPPGFEGVHRGRDAYIYALIAWKESFGENRWEPREIFDPGGARFGYRNELVARGTGSGVELRRQEFYACELEDGLLRRQWFAATQDGMLRLLGQ
jgi:hypothetical protein